MFKMARAMVLCLALMLTAVISPVSADSSTSVVVDGKAFKINVAPVMESGTTLLPVKAILDAMGVTSSWNNKDQTITAQGKGVSLWLQVGNKTAKVNNAGVTLQMGPKMIGGNAMVPDKFISDAFGVNISWDRTKRQVTITTAVKSNTANTVLYQCDFEKPNLDGWFLQDKWSMKKEGSNTVLTCSTAGIPSEGYCLPSLSWTDYDFSFKFKLKGPGCEIKFRDSFNYATRLDTPQGMPDIAYRMQLGEKDYNVEKNVGDDRFQIIRGRIDLKDKDFNTLKVSLQNNIIRIYLNDKIICYFTDRDNPILAGGVVINVFQNSTVTLDDFKATGKATDQKNTWVSTGGPFGGVGYDVRISPENKNIMYVTDLFSGVNKSIDGGKTWIKKNSGIYVRSGNSLDAIPIFCLTIDPNNPKILWAGSFQMKGIFKSTDAGETWVKMDNGVDEYRDITFRGFAVAPGNSDIVLAAGEIQTGIIGATYPKVKGKIYKTTDGGKSWRRVWEGGSLARVLIYDPTDPKTAYCSTGIFDREAYNTTGEGVLKTTDGGETWQNCNNGLESLFIGFLAMHPKDPKTLVCAAGNFTYSKGNGIFKTTDGGKSWTKILSGFDGEVFSVATFSSSNPDVIYAGSAQDFYRSDDGGKTWNQYTKPNESCYGPPGVRAGIPVSAVVDPDDPMTIFVNNYAGGIIKSTDGGKSWLDRSQGYTGETSFIAAVSANNPDKIYTSGKSGIFKSPDGGKSWEGLVNGIFAADFQKVAVDPRDDNTVLIADEYSGLMYRTTDGGSSWQKVFQKEGCANEPDKRHGFKDIRFAPSNPNIVYAGMRKESKAIDTYLKRGPSYGMYKSEDGGVTWKEINSGLESSDKNINCIVINPTNPDIVYIGTFQDGIFKTADGGKSWTAVSNGLIVDDVRSLAMDSTNTDVIYAGLGQGAGIYKTVNGGGVWTPINDGLFIECPSYLQRIGQITPGISLQKPKRTGDPEYSSMPWTLIDSVLIDPNDHNSIYISDYHLGVFKSVNGGKDWVSYNKGLDVKAVTSLCMYQSGSLMYATTAGGGIYKIGLR